MDNNNLSTPLNEISEKLTVISEELKKLPQEQKTISTAKTCPYRRAILRTALVIQIAAVLGFSYISTHIHPKVAGFLFLFSYITISVTGETVVYRLMKKKDVQKADAQAVKEKYNLTLDELDTYIKKLVDIRTIAMISSLVNFTLFYLLGDFFLESLFMTYALTTFASMAYIRMRGKIKVPKRLFLFDLPKGDTNTPLMHKPSEPSTPFQSGPSESSSSNFDWKYN